MQGFLCWNREQRCTRKISQSEIWGASHARSRRRSRPDRLLGSSVCLFHQSIAVVLNNLADLYREQGRYAEAEPQLMRALSIREKALGSDHPDVGKSLINLGELYRLQGRMVMLKLSMSALSPYLTPTSRSSRSCSGPTGGAL
jgi:tetratricopeptide (TPR) repeat protein